MKMDLVNTGTSITGNRQYREWVKSLKAKKFHQHGTNSSMANRHQLGDESEMLFAIPWRHHVEIFTHAKSLAEGMFYVAKTAARKGGRK